MKNENIRWRVTCLLEEIRGLNSRIISGDHNERGGLRIARNWAKDLEALLIQEPGVKSVWVNAHLAYGGFVCITWAIELEDGSTDKGAQTPIPPKK